MDTGSYVNEFYAKMIQIASKHRHLCSFKVVRAEYILSSIAIYTRQIPVLFRNTDALYGLINLRLL